MAFDFENNISTDMIMAGFELITVSITFKPLFPYVFNPPAFIDSLKRHNIIKETTHIEPTVRSHRKGIALSFENVEEVISFFQYYMDYVNTHYGTITYIEACEDPIYDIFKCDVVVVLDFNNSPNYLTSTIDISKLKLLPTSQLVISNLHTKEIICSYSFAYLLFQKVIADTVTTFTNKDILWKKRDGYAQVDQDSNIKKFKEVESISKV